MSKVENGNTVSVHYRGTLDDGTQFDSSHDRGEPLNIKVGAGQLISGFDSALEGMTIGETKNINLTPEQAYGDINEEAFQTVPKSSFPENFDFQMLGIVQGVNQLGQPFTARINAIEESEVILDFNHPMAGKNLNFEIELLKIEE